MMLSELLENDGIGTVLVESLDRLARDYRIQESLLIYLASKKIHLISARTKENVTESIQADPMRKALAWIPTEASLLNKREGSFLCLWAFSLSKSYA